MNKCKSFKPEIRKDSKVLILGSMPGVKSLEQKEYYAHPYNRFWMVMGILCKKENLHKLPYEEKIQTLLNSGFALWDVIKECQREGSLDSNIKNEAENDIESLLEKNTNIKVICLNGNKAFLAFKKHFAKLLNDTNLIIYKMPSTSPANAKYGIKELVCEWEKVLEVFK